MSRPALAILGVVVMTAIACAPAPAPASRNTAEDVAAINALATREMEAFSSVDTAALETIFAQDVIAMPPGEPAIQGRAALVTWAQAIGDQFTVAGAYTSTEVMVAGDWAVQRFTGRLTLTPKAGGSAMSETIKGIHVLQRQADDTWRITQDVWNADQPPPPAAAGSR
jgi:uncharacterized protein (TIGR02246 family)